MMLSKEIQEHIDAWVKKFPSGRQRSAVIAALHKTQDSNKGFLTVELMDAVANYLNIPAMQVYEVASFYSMFETKKVGRHSISICTNISCMLNGSDELVDYTQKKLGIHIGESTDDGKFYLKQEEECLAACCGAPMMMVDHKYYENLTTNDIDDILDKLD